MEIILTIIPKIGGRYDVQIFGTSKAIYASSLLSLFPHSDWVA